MKIKTLYIFSFVLFFMMTGCKDDFVIIENEKIPEGPLIETELLLSVSDFRVNSSSTREELISESEKVATEEEKRIDNIWVFQYAINDDGTGGGLLVSPTFYDLTATGDPENVDNTGIESGDEQRNRKRVKVILRKQENSLVCVVANTSNPNWATGENKSNFATYSGYEGQFFSELAIKLSDFKPIPMEGSLQVDKIEDDSEVVIDLKRMYAKLQIKINVISELKETLKPYQLKIVNYPYYCRVKSLEEVPDYEETLPANYAEEIQFFETSINVNKSDPTSAWNEDNVYEIYVPENLQGTNDNLDASKKSDKAPNQALKIILTMKDDKGKDYKYTVHPGRNETNNYNIKRDCVYKIKMNINSLDENIHTPSSNCFVVVPGEPLTFEPYNRIETGGQDGSDPDLYKIENYLNPEDEAKRIRYVKIIWQTKNAIGDNSPIDTSINPEGNGTSTSNNVQKRLKAPSNDNEEESDNEPKTFEQGNLVYFEENPVNPKYSTITVRTKKEGNALIAAYNKDDVILWSWHIWITRNDPANEGNAIDYDTWGWKGSTDGKTGEIITTKRVPGYPIMRCNLGALANFKEEKVLPKDDSESAYCNERRTYGMLYQWGRKDPFPPAKGGGGLINYIARDEKASVSNPFNDKSSNLELYDNGDNLISEKVEGYSYEDCDANRDNDNKWTLKLFRTIRYDATAGIDEEGSKALSVVGTTKSQGIKYSIQHPTTHIAAAKYFYNDKYREKVDNYINGGDWLPEGDGRLWGGLPSDNSMEKYSPKNDAYIRRNYGNKKTIFDPCPSGWRVPPGDLWLGLIKNGYYEFHKNQAGIKENFNLPKDGTVFKDFTYTFSYNRESQYSMDNGFLFCLRGWKNSDTKYYSFFPLQGTRIASGQPFGAPNCGNYHNATDDYTMSNGLKRVNILHLHHTSTTDMYITPFESLIWYIVKSVACPVRCVRESL